MKNFLEPGDVATFDLDEGKINGCGVDGMRSYHVTIRRKRDDEESRVEIEESCRDMIVEAVDDEDEAIKEPEINGAGESAIMTQ
jgi:hypothetical protein